MNLGLDLVLPGVSPHLSPPPRPPPPTQLLPDPHFPFLAQAAVVWGQQFLLGTGLHTCTSGVHPGGPWLRLPATLTGAAAWKKQEVSSGPRWLCRGVRWC